MTLSNEDRGFLEKRIDSEVKDIANTIGIARNEVNKKEWQIENDGDFALGWALASVYSDFSHYYSLSHKGNPEREDVDQAVEIITKRIREIKEAIFKCG